MAKKRMGRPLLSPVERKSRIVQFRCRDDLYELLGRAAAEGGRSISGEIEYRLGASFLRDANDVANITGKVTQAIEMLQDLAGKYSELKQKMDESK